MAKKLTERRAADRKIMADRLEALCDEFGASHERGSADREIWIDIELDHARVTITFEGDAPAAIVDNFCMAWNTRYDSPAKMTEIFGRVVGGEVNPHHRAKCMAFAGDFEALMFRMRSIFVCIRSGLAFDLPEETPVAIAA